MYNYIGDIMNEIIKINNLCKSYGSVLAVDNLTLSVKEGELYAFLGVNGAGKSTTISMICGNLRMDSGSISVCGMDVCKDSILIKNKIGVVFQDSTLDMSLSVFDNLKYRAGLYGITGDAFLKKYNKLETMFDLKDFKDKLLKNLSGGCKRRVDIARALINDPKILILDEPTTGLDPGTRKKLWNIIRKLREKNKLTVFLTTHYMEEAVDADFITILNKGRIVASGTSLELKKKYASDMLIIYDVSLDEVKELNLPYKKINNAFKIEVESTEVVADLIIKHKSLFKDFELVKGKMDDVFLAATGYELDGD